MFLDTSGDSVLGSMPAGKGVMSVGVDLWQEVQE